MGRKHPCSDTGFYAGVVVTEISPNYYAAFHQVTQFELTGDRFDILPEDAIGILSIDNENPLSARYNQSARNIFDIIDRTNETITLKVRKEESHDENNYLGAILSADRETIYWVNNSKPLP